MKRFLILLFCAAGTQLLSAQVITSSSLIVEKNASRYILPHGYRGFADAGVSVDLIQPEYTGFDITTTHGYQFNNILFVGGGTGLLGNPLLAKTSQRIAYSIPIFATVKTYITKTRIKPYVEFRAGYNIGLGYKLSYKYDWEYDNAENEHVAIRNREFTKFRGLYFLLGLGVEYGRFSAHIDWSPRRYITKYRSIDFNNNVVVSDATRLNGHFYTDFLSFCFGFNF